MCLAPKPNQAARVRHDAGFALVFVLVGLAMLAIVLSTVTQRLYLPQVTFAKLRSQIQSELAWEAAHLRALPLIAGSLNATRSQNSDARVPLNGAPFVLGKEHSDLALSVQDVGGLVDLNAASEGLVRELFLKLAPSSGITAVNELLALRAEQPIRAPETLLAALGFEGQELAKAMRLTTVRSGSATLNPATVSTELVSLFGYQTPEAFERAEPDFFRTSRIRILRVERWEE